ncbi:Chordin [Acropora cervicornis]|uniref:Chordin n=1 Tax=Acropora cervicornis TaxID=6130 RepID=A0AAD9PRV9_ACRCE|nr:Chordin [Acropora cervicornis]
MGNTKDRQRIHLSALLILLPLCLASDDKPINMPVGTEYQPSSSKPGGCNFGYRHYELGRSWNPEIAPFGVMFCVICTCNKVSNSQVTGKVACRNIRDRCPTTSCARPKIEAGHCCATCPDGLIGKVVLELYRISFAIVTIELKFLLSLFIRDSMWPRKLRTAAILNAEGSLIEDINIQRKAINGTQVCLVWNQMTSKQIQSLKQEKLSLLLKLKRQHTAGLLGDIKIYKAYSDEAFEALLSSQDQTSVALASFNLAKNGKALRIQLWYNGSHGLGKSEDVIKVYN